MALAPGATLSEGGGCDATLALQLQITATSSPINAAGRRQTCAV